MALDSNKTHQYLPASALEKKWGVTCNLSPSGMVSQIIQWGIHSEQGYRHLNADCKWFFFKIKSNQTVIQNSSMSQIYCEFK